MIQPDHGNVQHVPLDELIAHLDGLIAAFEEHPDPATREAVMELLQGIDAMHREAFNRLAAFLEDHHARHLLVEAAQADRLLNSVLNLYDALPEEAIIPQVEAALARVLPYIESHGGVLKVLSVEGGRVHVEMGGACHGCAGSITTLRRGVEQALRQGFPGFEEVVVHEPAPEIGLMNSQGFISLEHILPARPIVQGPVFQSVAALEDLSPGAMKPVALDGVRALVANVDGEPFAVGEVCPGSSLPLTLGTLEGALIICPWHNERYDVRSGKCVETAGRRDEPRLPVYPVAVVGGEIRIAVNVPARPTLLEALP